MVNHKAVRVFYSYSHKDERLREQLETHLALLKREGIIDEWHDRKILGGEEWASAIDEHLETADIILLLVSANFVASEYCWGKEMRRALERHQAGQACVIPVILRPVDWHTAPFGKLQALPSGGEPVTRWSNRDQAWLDVAMGIRKLAQNRTPTGSSDAEGKDTPLDRRPLQPTAARAQPIAQVSISRVPEQQQPADPPLTFGQQLGRLRILAKLTQEELAGKINCGVTTIAAYEHDRRRPRKDMFAQLATALDPRKEDLVAFEAAWRAQIPREDWGDAPDISDVYGREGCLSELQRWVVQDHCRVVIVLGSGGIGKTTLSAKLARLLRDDFDYVFWRSLHRLAPTPDSLLRECIQFLSNQTWAKLPDRNDELIRVLLGYLRSHRCLLVLDNFDTVLRSGDGTGNYRDTYEAYGALIHHIGAAKHNSCLLITSRERPEGVQNSYASTVRTRQLPGLNPTEVQAFLSDKHLHGTDAAWAEFTQHYAGNPQCLQLVSGRIQRVFQGDIARYMQVLNAEGGSTPEGVLHLLDQQFERLTDLEWEIVYWLVIEREPIRREDLRQDIKHPVKTGDLIDALDSLLARSLVEISDGQYFKLPPYVMDYLNEHLVRWTPLSRQSKGLC